MLKKKFLTKKDIKIFKQQYEQGDINTEVISNLLQPHYESKYPEIKDYCDFWWPEDKQCIKMIGQLLFSISQYGEYALQEAFGKYDFSFEGNRKYKNYILDFDGLTIIAPSKREVVILDTPDFRTKLVDFEKSYAQFVVNYLFKHYEKLSDFEQDSLKEMKICGLLNYNNMVEINAIYLDYILCYI